MKTQVLLDFASVSFSYSKIPVLSEVDLTVRSGEVVGFLGANGSGKTTSFLLATGLLQAHSGEIRVVGFEPRKSKQWCYRVGVLTARAGLYPRLTVKRNLAFFAELYSSRIDLEAHIVQHGLQEFTNKPAGQLSQGYLRRLSLARATIHQPELLLLDEPADGLDPRATEELHQYLKKFSENGGGVLLTSHRLDEVERICDRVSLLDKGEIRLSGTPEELLSSGHKQSLRELLLSWPK